jgi:hypothetical protein
MLRRITAVLLAAPLVGLLVAAPPSAQAAPDPSLTITAVTLTRTSVLVSGLNTYPIGVTVKGGYKSSEPGDLDMVLNVVLERTSGTGPLRTIVSTDLKRTAGTLDNGTWTGPLYATSTANGTYKVTGVMTGPYWARLYNAMIDPTPFDGPSVTITGVHQPRITASVSPKVVPFGSPYTIRWAVTDAATGKPYGTRLTVGLGVDAPCAEGGAPLYRTDTNGIVTKSYTAADANSMNCLALPGKPYLIAGLGFFVTRPGIVSAVPSKTSATVGTIVPVNGSVAGAPYRCTVVLQRLYGATQWRGVSLSQVRQSGRFTVNAQPAYKGLISYRVYFPACHNFASGISKVFYIRGL